MYFNSNHSNKKWKNSLQGSLDQVLFAGEVELPKIIVPRLAQHTPNANTEVSESQNGQNICILFI